jgi:hypothetical protein
MLLMRVFMVVAPVIICVRFFASVQVVAARPMTQGLGFSGGGGKSHGPRAGTRRRAQSVTGA